MTSRPATPVAQLEVERAALLEGLQKLARHTKLARAAKAIIRFDDGCLDLWIGGCHIRAPASGRWLGEARVPGAFVLAMARHLPSSDPIAIRVEAGRLHLAGASINCRWQKPEAAGAEIPIDASLMQLLRIGSEYTDDALERSGILSRVNEARAERERRIEKALAALAPLGVRHADVARVVDGSDA